MLWVYDVVRDGVSQCEIGVVLFGDEWVVCDWSDGLDLLCLWVWCLVCDVCDMVCGGYWQLMWCRF